MSDTRSSNWPDSRTYRFRNGRNVADFEYLPERGLLIVPTFTTNRVAAYRVRNR